MMHPREQDELAAKLYREAKAHMDVNNASKDFRAGREFYEQRDCDCLLCGQLESRIVAENELAYVISDAFPVTVGHTLVIPKLHVKDYFGLKQPELPE